MSTPSPEQTHLDAADAFILGRLQGQVDGHEDRLKVINGSILRSAEAQEKLSREVAESRSRVETRMDRLTEVMAQDRAVRQASEEARERALAEQKAAIEANERRGLARWQIILIAVGIAVSLLVGIITAAATLLS